jgi:hypothetical protein
MNFSFAKLLKNFPWYVALSTVVLWIAFSQLNELKNADDPNTGCCKDSSCGKSGWDGFIWVVVMVMSIVGTLWCVWEMVHGGRTDGKGMGVGAAFTAAKGKLTGFGRKGFNAADSGNTFGQRYGRAGFNRTVFGAPIMY